MTQQARTRLLGDSPALNRVRAQIHAWARRPAVPVLITGETGAGKEVVAQALHAATRPRGPWHAVNCAELQRERVGVLLFGSVRGVFTGVGDNPGAIGAAQGGTLFLDEIGEMPLEAQASLLRVLNDRRVCPVGGTRHHPVDVQFLFATHRDLTTLVRAGRFRADLYYRIAGLPIRVPALREHIDDLPVIAHALEPEVSARLTPGAWARLQAAPWAGNVRELRLVLYRTGTAHPDGPIDARHVALDHGSSKVTRLPTGRKTLEETKRDRILEELRLQAGNIRAASRVLRCSPTTIYRYTRQGLAG